MITTRARVGGVLAMTLLTVSACGGSEPPEIADEPAASAEEDEFEAPALEVPEDCPKANTELELWTHAASWANENNEPYGAGEACLVVQAGEPFTVTVHNPETKGVLNLDHNFAIYGDSIALDTVFQSPPVKKGKEKSIDVSSMEAGTYLFRCDYHVGLMKGVLVVE